MTDCGTNPIIIQNAWITGNAFFVSGIEKPQKERPGIPVQGGNTFGLTAKLVSGRQP